MLGLVGGESHSLRMYLSWSPLTRLFTCSERHWQEHRAQDPGGKAKAKPGPVRRECRQPQCSLKTPLMLYVIQDPPDWEEIIKYFRGSELQNFFTKVLEENIKALIKPQYVDHIPRAIKGSATVSDMLDGKSERDNKAEIVNTLDLEPVLDRDVKLLSGGELQRFAIGMSCVQKANM